MIQLIFANFFALLLQIWYNIKSYTKIYPVDEARNGVSAVDVAFYIVDLCRSKVTYIWIIIKYLHLEGQLLIAVSISASSIPRLVSTDYFYFFFSDDLDLLSLSAPEFFDMTSFSCSRKYVSLTCGHKKEDVLLCSTSFSRWPLHAE